MDGNGDYLTLKQAMSLLPGPPTLNRVQSWVRDGICHGTVKLQTIRVGRTHFTTAQWVEEFMRDSDAAYKNSREPAPETPRQKTKRRAARGKRLRKLGV